MKRAGFFVLLVLVFMLLAAFGAGRDVETQIPTESEIPSALSEPSETARSESQPESMEQEAENGATMNPCKCGWYGDPGCRPKYKADLFPHTLGCDMFPCTADIHGIVSTHVETVVLMSRTAK